MWPIQCGIVRLQLIRINPRIDTQLVYIAQRTPELAIVVFIGTNPSLRNPFRVTSEKFHLPEVLVQNALCAAETADEAQSSTNFLVQLCLEWWLMDDCSLNLLFSQTSRSLESNGTRMRPSLSLYYRWVIAGLSLGYRFYRLFIVPLSLFCRSFIARSIASLQLHCCPFR